jgi:hypothetical protein
MPALSLVVCVHGERELLERLLRHTAELSDDIVIVHDGPDSNGIRSLVESTGGRFFERPRAFQQEPHWPFAWGQAAHDWVLRLDADEFPSEDLKIWLKKFRGDPEPDASVSGYTCIWPLWNGQRAISKKWPAGRIFLFRKDRVRFFGMVEQVPVPDGKYQPLDLILHHQPLRKSYGFRNLVFRKQAYRWRERIATSLLKMPSDLACWRWGKDPWPAIWEEIRRHPLRTAATRLTMESLRGLRAQWRSERRFFLKDAFCAPIHHALIGVKLWQLRRLRTRTSQPRPAEGGQIE